MKTNRNIIKGKYISAAAILLAVIFAVIYINRTVFSVGLINQDVDFIDPVSYCANGDNAYLINNSGMEIVILRDGKYQYSVNGTNADDGFYSAREVISDNEGNFYVLDKLMSDNGKNIDAERVLKYNTKGNFEEIVYEYPHEDGSSVLQLYDLEYTDNSLQIVRTDKDGYFEIINLSESRKQKNIKINYADIYENAWDFSVNNSDVYISTKKGTVERINEDGSVVTLYAGMDNDTYYSIPTKIQSMSDGSLYYNDIGLRTINKISPDGKSTVAVDAGEPFSQEPDEFNENPIYMDFFVNENGDIYTIYSDTVQDEENEGTELVVYNLYVKSADGTVLFIGSSAEKSGKLQIQGFIVLLMCILACILAVYLLAVIIYAARKANLSNTTKLQAAVVLTAVCVAGVSAYILVNSSNSVYYEEVMNKIANITEITARNIDEKDIDNINSPRDFRNESYNSISSTVKEVLESDLNKDNGMYCVIYKVQSDIVTAIYADDDMYGTGYPMPGAYDGSAEKEIYETGKPYDFYSHKSADGTYMFELAPVFSDNGDVIALIEVGIDLYTFSENNKKQVVNTIISLVAVVMVAVLMFTELAAIAEVMKKRKICVSGKIDASLVRPIAFLLFFASNMPTAFLPNFSKSLYDASFPLPVEVASALPVSSELLFASVTALCLGFAVSKTGSKILTMAGAAMLGLGSLMCAFVPDLTTLIIASSVTGIGDGLLMVALNSYIAGYDDDTVKSGGFAAYNAALLAGLNCGTVLGSVIADKFGYSVTYIGAAAVSLLILPFAAVCIKNHEKTAEKKSEKAGVGATLRFVFRPKIIKYFVLILMPYLICAAFLNYFFPLFGEDNSLTPTQISLAFLLMGVISVYAGPGLSSLTERKLGSKKSMLLATSLYAAGLVIFIVRPQVSSCYIAIALFAFADSFGYTSQSVYYSSLSEVSVIGDGPAMGISNAAENIASTVGPLIFGAALTIGTIKGISIIAIAFIALAVIFVLSSFEIRAAKIERISMKND